MNNLAKDYNCALAAVDIAVVDCDRERVLLGRKPDQKLFRFIGGFVDVADESYEEAALRELREEAPNIEVCKLSLRNIGNEQICDERYLNDKDRIFTTLFFVAYIFGDIKAGDDLEELKWIDFKDIEGYNIRPEHCGLLEKLITHLKITSHNV